MNDVLNGIENIIFDLGEVIVDVDTSRTVKAFEALSPLNISSLFSFDHQALFFSQFEKGLIDEKEFRDELRDALQNNVSDKILDNAWNKMLGDTPNDKLDILLLLKNEYRTFALSNTNSIHIRFINNYLSERKKNDCLENYFHQTYYSFDLNTRKPDRVIYELVLQRENLSAEKTLMVDDRFENLETASSLGLKVFHIKRPDEFYALFKR